MHSLARLRLRLTAWYVGVFLSILALLGGGLFLAIRHRMSQQLDASLRAAASALMQAARIREAELAGAKGVVADAVDELHIPDRALYLFAAGATPIKPAEAPDWIREAAREAECAGVAHRDLEREDHIVRLYAERFSGANGRLYVATAVADRLELEHEYASLIRAFAAAALAALLLAAGGGYMLTRQSTAPIEREATRLGEITGNLLTLARADAGEWPVAREALYLDDAVAGAVEAARTLAERKRVVVEVGTFEEAKILADPALVRQLLLIVLDNAIKFTPSGGRVRLDVSAHDGRAAVVVSDTGIGIPAEQLPHVFERFYRGDPARREADGAGLGLAIARWIADVHGARIDVGSEPAVGTRVTLSFPLAL